MCRHVLNAQVSIRYPNQRWYECPECYFEVEGQLADVQVRTPTPPPPPSLTHGPRTSSPRLPHLAGPVVGGHPYVCLPCVPAGVPQRHAAIPPNRPQVSTLRECLRPPGGDTRGRSIRATGAHPNLRLQRLPCGLIAGEDIRRGVPFYGRGARRGVIRKATDPEKPDPGAPEVHETDPPQQSSPPCPASMTTWQRPSVVLNSAIKQACARAHGCVYTGACSTKSSV